MYMYFLWMFTVFITIYNRMVLSEKISAELLISSFVSMLIAMFGTKSFIQIISFLIIFIFFSVFDFIIEIIYK